MSSTGINSGNKAKENHSGMKKVMWNLPNNNILKQNKIYEIDNFVNNLKYWSYKNNFSCLFGKKSLLKVSFFLISKTNLLV